MGFDLFSPNNLIVTSSPTTSVLENTINLETHSFFNETMKFLIETRKEYNEGNKLFYKSILESDGNFIVVNEAFSNLFTWIRGVIDKIVIFMKKMFNKFLTMLNKIFKSDKHLKAKKDYFAKFNDEHEFKINGYSFSFKNNVPSLDSLITLQDGFSDLKLEDAVAKKDGTAVTLKSMISSDPDLAASIINDRRENFIKELDDKKYDIYRGSTINEGPITQNEYANELFKQFRSGEISNQDLVVNAEVVNETYNRFDNYDKVKVMAEKDKERVNRLYNDLKKNIETSLKNSNIDSKIFATVSDNEKLDVSTSSTKLINALDMFIKAKGNEVQELSNIHALAFAAKLDAIKDCFIQDKNVLYKALQKVQSDFVLKKS